MIPCFLGTDFSDEEYLPIGNFFVLENNNVSSLPSSSTTPQLQEVILKEPARRINASMQMVDDMKKAHSIGGYCSKLTLINKLAGFHIRNMKEKDSLKPSATLKTFIVWDKEGEDKWKCQLVVIEGGNNLDLQLQADSNDFKGFPFQASSIYTTIEVRNC